MAAASTASIYRATVLPRYLATSLLADVQRHILPGITHWQSPNFFAYFPANSSTAGLLGEMLSGAFNVIGFSWISSPAATELETVVLDWLADAMALPPAFHSVKSGVKLRWRYSGVR